MMNFPYLAGVGILDVRIRPASDISHQHLLHPRHHHYVRVGVGDREDGLQGERRRDSLQPFCECLSLLGPFSDIQRFCGRLQVESAETQKYHI